MSDTPRMESALMDAPEVGLANVWKVGCDIERELNAANQRIKRLEEAGNELYDGWRSQRNNMDKYLEAWNQAKEANP